MEQVEEKRPDVSMDSANTDKLMETKEVTKVPQQSDKESRTAEVTVPPSMH